MSLRVASLIMPSRRSKVCHAKVMNIHTTCTSTKPLRGVHAPKHTIQKRIGNSRRGTSNNSKLQSKSGSKHPSPSSSFNPIAWYSKKLETHPITTKCITSGIISGSGDLICQYIVHNNKKKAQKETDSSDDDNRNDAHTFSPDWIRTGRFSILGFGLVAPIVHNWYGLLMMRIPGQSMQAVLKRLFCDQILFAPLFIPTFMTGLMTLEGKGMDEMSKTLKRDVVDVVVSNWALWVPAMFVNFKFVPIQWQVLYSNCVGLVWNVFLSWKTQEGGDVEDI